MHAKVIIIINIVIINIVSRICICDQFHDNDYLHLGTFILACMSGLFLKLMKPHPPEQNKMEEIARGIHVM